MKILIDNGHGKETPGKRSPDERLKEFAYTREIAERVVDRLQNEGIDAVRIVTEEYDVALSERVRRGNAFGKNAILISIPQVLYWTANLYICQRTNCPAVLVENFFQDNREDVDFLLSEEGKKCVTDIMVEGVMGYMSKNDMRHH